MPIRIRPATIILALALITGSLALVHDATAQRGSRAVTIARARALFEEMQSAWSALRALDVRPADANGAVAGWDRHWARRLARAERATSGACFEAPRTDCTRHERYVLLCNTAGDIAGARASVFRDDADDGLVDAFEWRRAVADEAARRRAAGLSCEDLPAAAWEVMRRDDGSFTTTDGRPLVAPPGEGALDPTSEVIERERPSLRLCWEASTRGVEAPPTISLEVAMTIDTSGTVTAVEVTGDADGGLAECIRRRIRRWPFARREVETQARFVAAFPE